MTDDEAATYLASGFLFGHLVASQESYIRKPFEDLRVNDQHQITMTMPTVAPRVLVTITIDAKYDPTLEPF